MKRRITTTDAVVNQEDGLRWATILLRQDPDEVVKEILDAEPFALGLAISTAHHAANNLRQRGVPEPIPELVMNHIVVASAYGISLMRSGYRQLWADVIEPTDDVTDEPQKGADHV